MIPHPAGRARCNRPPIDRQERSETIACIRRLSDASTPAAEIARELQLPQAVVLSVLQKGTLPSRESHWIQPEKIFGQAGAE